MRAQLSRELRDDLKVSHAFINRLSASFQGVHAFETVFGQLSRSEHQQDNLAKTGLALEAIAGWWREFEQQKPLFSCDDRPVLTAEGSKAWRLLDVVAHRLRALVGELSPHTSVESLLDDPVALQIRVASLCEAAYVERHLIEGEIARHEVFGQENREPSLQRQLIEACGRVRRAESCFAIVEDLGDDIDAPTATEILDRTLLLPAEFGRAVVDVARTFSLYTGAFDYADAGIPDGDEELWTAHGFQPHAAGQWFLAGIPPERALRWISVGACDPLIAGDYLWRGFSPEDARPWLLRFMDGLAAAAWRDAGCDSEVAGHWIAEGFFDPARIAGPVAPPALVM